MSWRSEWARTVTRCTRQFSTLDVRSVSSWWPTAMSTRPRTDDVEVSADESGGDGRQALLRFLQTDPADAGCDRTLELLHVYAELELPGADPEQAYPGITAHLRSCGPCIEDF